MLLATSIATVRTRAATIFMVKHATNFDSRPRHAPRSIFARDRTRAAAGAHTSFRIWAQGFKNFEIFLQHCLKIASSRLQERSSGERSSLAQNAAACCWCGG